MLLTVVSVLLFADSIKITVDAESVYKVSAKDLEPMGWKDVPSDALALSMGGSPQYIYVNDGGDGIWSGDDWFAFVGTRMPGLGSTYDENTPNNTYLLTLDSSLSKQCWPLEVRPASEKATPSMLMGERFLEEDYLMMRFVEFPNESNEMWYWKELKCTDEKPFKITIPLEDLDPRGQAPIELETSAFGWSSQAHSQNQTDHQITVHINGNLISDTRWNGKGTHRWSTRFRRQWMQSTENVITVSVPYRTNDQDQAIVDVSVLNWIKLTYPKNPVLESGQHSWTCFSDRAVLDQKEDTLLLRSDGGWAWLNADSKSVIRSNSRDQKWHAVVGDHYRPPKALVRDNPTHWLQSSQAYHYLMISAPELMDAIQPLADYHRKKGLKVAVIDINDVYDECNYGQPHPRAIRDFIEHAYDQWQEPKLEYVLLVGDAGWDSRVDTARWSRYADDDHAWATIPFTEYNQKISRNLIPTYNYFPFEGHSASDNWFASVSGDDFVPDVALGRFPLVTPEEVTAVVNKTIRYMEQPVDEWMSRLLWITNEQRSFQNRSDKLAEKSKDRGLKSVKIYPESTEVSNEKNTQKILESWEAGLVIFYGHGGRFIWRTGPPDFRKNHDLFTLSDLDHLQNTDHLPIVLSLTCYTSPFDHPTADSLGEKLLRLPNSGAIGVIGASWRNSPSLQMAEEFVEALTIPGTLGQAFVRSKQKLNSRQLIETYNLLGDPAVPLRVMPFDGYVFDHQYENLTLQRSEPSWRDLRLFWYEGDTLNRTDMIKQNDKLEIEAPSQWDSLRIVCTVDDHIAVAQINKPQE
ncbi:MAG: hypothetical protein KDC35_16075 [Acidobacteria bacterium]|nr:hypothetical protein [Acidobacteriota bacterium]